MNRPIPYRENRPWGKFEQFCLNTPATVKLISVDPHAKLSLQYHHQRDEYWRIVAGSGGVVIGNETQQANVGDEFWIPRLTHHRLFTRDQKMVVLEVAFGHFDEKDIVRLEDMYRRT